MSDNMDISKIHINPNNPRIIKDGKFEKLCRSIQEFPKMLELRPIIVDSDGMILGGNMRFKALQHLKMDIKPEWVKEGVLSDEEKRRFVIEDIGVDPERLQVITVEAPEAPRLKERVAFFCKSIDDYKKIKEVFYKKDGELDVDKLLELL